MTPFRVKPCVLRVLYLVRGFMGQDIHGEERGIHVGEACTFPGVPSTCCGHGHGSEAEGASSNSMPLWAQQKQTGLPLTLRPQEPPGSAASRRGHGSPLGIYPVGIY